MSFAKEYFPTPDEAQPAPILPEIVDSFAFEAEPLPEPPQLVHGLLHQGSKFAIGGGSKSFKTFALLDLGLSVAYGKEWLGLESEQGRVCYLNFELPEWSIQKRLRAIEDAKGIACEAGRLDLWNLRGYSASYDELVPQLTARLQDKGYSLVILDPLYKLLGGADENSARDITKLLNSIESLNVQTKAAVAFGSHFSKGNQAGKESIDRISGSGVFARDPDAIATVTKLADEGTYAMEFTLRNLAPLEKFGVRWEYPLFTRDNGLNPENLKKAGGAKAKYSPDTAWKVLDQSEPLSTTEWKEQCTEETGMSERTFYDLKKELERSGRVLNSQINKKWQCVRPK